MSSLTDLCFFCGENLGVFEPLRYASVGQRVSYEVTEKLTLLTCSGFRSDGGGEVAAEEDVAPFDDAVPGGAPATISVPLLSMVASHKTRLRQVCSVDPVQ